MADLFVLALGAALYPTLIAIVLVVLRRPQPQYLLAAYLAGAMLAGLGVGALFVFGLDAWGVLGRERTKSDASAIVDIAAGAAALALVTLLVLRRDPRPARLRKPAIRPGTPTRMQRAIGQDSLKVAFGLGVLLDLTSVWYFVALKDIATSGYSTATDVMLLVGFNLIRFAVVEIPLVAYLARPDRAAGAFERGELWIRARARPIAMGVGGLVGGYLLIRGVTAL